MPLRRVLLQQFDHHAVRGLGVDKCDKAVDTLAGFLVYKADAASAQLFQGARYVGHGEADVVAAFAPACQKAGRTALSIRGRQKLNRAVAGVKKRDLDAMVGRLKSLQETKAQDAAVGGEGIVEVLHDDADVVDPGVGQLQCL